MGEVVEVAEDLCILEEEPEATRLGEVFQEDLGAVEEDVELLKAKRGQRR